MSQPQCLLLITSLHLLPIMNPHRLQNRLITSRRRPQHPLLTMRQLQPRPQVTADRRFYT